MMPSRPRPLFGQGWPGTLPRSPPGDPSGVPSRPTSARADAMIFNSAVFLFGFLPLTLAGYFLLMRARRTLVAKSWLVLASAVFYGWWMPAHVPLLACSIGFNYRVGVALMAQAGRPAGRRLLQLGVAANLLALAFFKYSNFIVVNLDLATGAQWHPPVAALPLGISFFTFTQIAWLVDSWQGKVRDRSALDYALFVTFFPHLIAGPILHHREMMGQFASRWTHALRSSHLLRGMFIFSIGLSKKVLLADTFAGWADEGFDRGVPLDLVAAWSASLSYTFQLYFDFSGYCDMAMGAALLFNIWLPVNFNSPYKALDIQDFWRRWHITLSRYLRDYLYVPLGGNRGGSLSTSTNLMVTFLLGGLWHGASWMFVAWGALHGVAIVAHRLWKQRGLALPGPLAWVLTFVFVDVAWVFFRARSWADASRVLHGMVDVGSLSAWSESDLATHHFAWAGALLDPLLAVAPATVVAQLTSLVAIAGALALMSRPNSVALMRRHGSRAAGVAGAGVLFVVASMAMLASRQTPFLYFNF